jgi:hypothetical protein
VDDRQGERCCQRGRNAVRQLDSLRHLQSPGNQAGQGAAVDVLHGNHRRPFFFSTTPRSATISEFLTGNS